MHQDPSRSRQVFRSSSLPHLPTSTQSPAQQTSGQGSNFVVSPQRNQL
jgi:hypothetical protein